MAPNGGHLLVSKAIRLIRFGVDKASRVVRDKVSQVAQVEARTQTIPARIQNQPINRLQAIRQGQTRSYSTGRFVQNAVRYISNAANTSSGGLRSNYPQSRTRPAISQITSRTPFASTLRPNLTGGTLSRSAGGYNVGAGRVGGARYFSHGPAPAAEVVQNVSQAVRAFWLSGQKARFNGTNPRSGDKRFRAVTDLQDRARHHLDISHAHSAGSFVDFKVSPTITAVGPLSTVPQSSSYSDDCEGEEYVATITNTTVISNLAVDFARALKDLAAIMNDLKHLATLGDLPLELVNPVTLRVRFPGCDADTVEAICRELNIRRGIVGQDEDFETQHGAEMALLFPFAPSKPASDIADQYDNRAPKRHKREHVDWHGMMSPAFSSGTASSPHAEHIDNSLGILTEDGEIIENPWLSTPSEYSSLRPTDDGNGDVAMFFAPRRTLQPKSRKTASLTSDNPQLEGLEAIYRFIEVCDEARR